MNLSGCLRGRHDRLTSTACMFVSAARNTPRMNAKDVVWHPLCPSLPCCFPVREGKFFPWRHESSSRNLCKTFLSTVSKETFGTFSVLFGTRFVLHCQAVLLFGRVGFSHGDMRVAVETYVKLSFLQFQKRRSALFRCCLAPVLSFTAMLFCCSGGSVFLMAS